MEKLKFNICDINEMISVSVKKILKESKRSKVSDKKTKEAIRTFFSNASWLDDDMPDKNEKISYIDYFFREFKSTFYHDPHMNDRPIIRLEPAIATIALDFGFVTSPQDRNLTRLGKIVTLMDRLSINGKYDLSKLPIDVTFDYLDSVFGSILDKNEAEERNKIRNMEFKRNNEYEVYGPIDFNTAHKIGDNSCPSSKLCYTQGKETWDNYTLNGINNVYVILKKGWENIEPKHTGGVSSPYDEYGLSMVFVFVNPEGGIDYCNTRWNHQAQYDGNYSCDHAMNEFDISKLVGAPFDVLFKPKSKEELSKFGYIPFSEVQSILDNGTDPSSIMSVTEADKLGFRYVTLRNKRNFIDENNKLLSDNWFDAASSFHEGFAIVVINAIGYNYLGLNGKLLLNEWYAFVNVFSENVGLVTTKSGKCNFVDKNGKFLFDYWFDGADDFCEGFAAINYIDKGENFINKKGELLSKQWFQEATRFKNGMAAVSLEDGWTYLYNDGTLMKGRFSAVGGFHFGWATVYTESLDMYNYVDKDGNLLSESWFDYAGTFRNGFGCIFAATKGYNFVSQDGKILSDIWFEDCDNFTGIQLAWVKKHDGNCNMLKADGKLLSPIDFEAIGGFSNNIAGVKKDQKYNYINVDGKIISNEWFDEIEPWSYDSGMGYIKKTGTYYKVYSDGTLIKL